MNLLRSVIPALALAMLAACATPGSERNLNGPVATEQGLVSGTGNEIRSFKGIPYTKSPLGDLRWRSPQPADAWSDVRDGSRFGPAYQDSVRKGRWQESAQFCYFDYPIRDLAGSTLGVIGDGALGQAVGPALDAGQISGAGFDVVSVEPPPENHPFMKLLDRPDFILTPHVAWASDEAVQGLADQLIDNVEAFVRGRPANVV